MVAMGPPLDVRAAPLDVRAAPLDVRAAPLVAMAPPLDVRAPWRRQCCWIAALPGGLAMQAPMP